MYQIESSGIMIRSIHILSYLTWSIDFLLFIVYAYVITKIGIGWWADGVVGHTILFIWHIGSAPFF